jgi:hypothetical protein
MDDCFPINGNASDPKVLEIEGIIHAYRSAVPHIEFAGPTFVSNILRTTKKFAEAWEKDDIYTVALILTDG